MSQPLRREDPTRISHISSRTLERRYWFIHNPPLESQMLGYFGKLKAKYEAKVYALSLMDNHSHTAANFPNMDRANFMRDFKSQYQRETKRSELANFPGGPLWNRRYDEQELPLNEDVEKYFWYVVLQQVSAGICDQIEDCPNFNCFYAAISGEEIQVEYCDLTSYKKAKLRNPAARREEFVECYPLKFERLPGHEHLSQEEYKELMLARYPVELERTLRERKERGINRCLTRKERRRIKPGAVPTTPSEDGDFARRPIVLSCCPHAFRESMETYQWVRFEHRRASKAFRAGDLTVSFPLGTYRPPSLVRHVELSP